MNLSKHLILQEFLLRVIHSSYKNKEFYLQKKRREHMEEENFQESPTKKEMIKSIKLLEINNFTLSIGIEEG